jgi:hypothetical protein
MTEDEAKTKWCVLSSPAAGLIKCMGSDCMGWRWTRPDWTPPIAGEIQIPGVMRWYVNGREVGPPPSDIDGHCGLAGKP